MVPPPTSWTVRFDFPAASADQVDAVPAVLISAVTWMPAALMSLSTSPMVWAVDRLTGGGGAAAIGDLDFARHEARPAVEVVQTGGLVQAGAEAEGELAAAQGAGLALEAAGEQLLGLGRLQGGELVGAQGRASR